MLTWDENKRVQNLKRHGIDFANLDSVFDHAMNSEEDRSAHHTEFRIRSLGLLHGRVVLLIWTPVGDDARIISCRYGDRYDTQKYFKSILY
ncbi:BrnT family toxin [Duganella sp. SG902]|uniref:BrnT family toxin n=1 Tax=Duganella sp. SG902 TaxID=2587016 RepID=UPI00159DEBE0